MKKLNLICLIAFLVQSPVVTNATVLVKLGAPSKTEIKDLKLTESVQLDGATNPLPRVTQGLRKKKVVFAMFSVYVAQFFTAAKPEFASVPQLKESLLKGMPLVVTMTFLRDVNNEKIIEGFKDVFEKTGVEMDKAPFDSFLAAVKKFGDIKDRQVLTFVFHQVAGKDTFSAQSDGKEVYSYSDGSLAPFLNMWLGTAMKGKELDSGLVQLQEQLLKP